MKVKLDAIIVAAVFFGVSQLTLAQCPQNCDNFNNTHLGANQGLPGGFGNTAVGWGALLQNNGGDGSTAVGNLALSNSTSSHNTAVGESALENTTTGTFNAAIGDSALKNNLTGSNNTAAGHFALLDNTTGNENLASGVNALLSNDSGSYNTATGFAALTRNITSNDNTATGWGALSQNVTGGDNTATGLQALASNFNGGSNTAVGVNALYSNIGGSNNIGLGIGAGGALTTGDNNIDIANAGIAGESAKIRIGTKNTHKNTYIAGIYGVTVPRGLGVIVDSSGHLGTSTSSARFKEEIKPMDKASEAILSLHPVTFRYKEEFDPEGIPQFGLVAEQVEKVNPDLVARDAEGKPYSVRYEAVNAMLLNEFLKEHRKVEKQQAMIVRIKSTVAKQDTTITDLKLTVALQQKQFRATVAQQQKEIKTLTNALHEQESQIQKVSAWLNAADQSAPGLVINDQFKTTK